MEEQVTHVIQKSFILKVFKSIKFLIATVPNKAEEEFSILG